MAPTRPRLVVVMHGVTSKPEEAPEEMIDTPLHARWYWGFPMIQGLSGFPGDSEMRLVQPVIGGNLFLSTVKAADWAPSANVDVRTADLSPILFPKASFTLPAGVPTRDGIRSFISTMMKPGPNPTTAVMVNFRDGSKHLMPQLAETLDQIYDGYQAAFGKLPLDAQPQIYLLGHSFGGVIARAIAANPTGADHWGNKLDPLHRTKADFIRSRTVLIATISSPHEGTPMGDQASDAAAMVRRRGGNIKAIVGSVDTLMKTEPLKSLGIATNFAAAAQSGMEAALDSISGERDCLQDLTRMMEYNRGILAPDTARRRDGGSQIPVFTMSGRSPGGLYYDRERGVALFSQKMLPNSCVDALRSGLHGKSASLLYIIQGLLHREGYGKEGKKPWGTARIPEGDLFSSPYKGVGPAQARALSAGFEPSMGLIASVVSDFLKGKPYSYGADGEYDSDGFLGWDSGHGVTLTGGRWYRVYGSQYGPLLPWDMDNHQSICHNIGNGMWIYNELISQAGPFGAPGHLSRWPMGANTPPKKSTITVQVTSIHDVENDLDPLPNDADFTVYVRIAGQLHSAKGEDDVRTATKFPAFVQRDLPNSVVPISIGVIERDGLPGNPDDLCAISPAKGRDNIHILYDTRTKRIWGDTRGAAGEVLQVTGLSGVYNRAQIKFKVTQS